MYTNTRAEVRNAPVANGADRSAFPHHQARSDTQQNNYRVIYPGDTLVAFARCKHLTYMSVHISGLEASCTCLSGGFDLPYPII